MAKAKGLGPEWLSSGVARVVELVSRRAELPEYFAAREKRVNVAPNLTVWVVGRQALISLKLLAASPSQRKHLEDLRALQPSRKELREAAQFVRSYDSSPPALDDLERVLTDIGGGRR